jgi:hypothetical protein
MKLLISNSPVICLFGILIAFGCYVFAIWLVGGFLSFAKLVPDRKTRDFISEKSC